MRGVNGTLLPGIPLPFSASPFGPGCEPSSTLSNVTVVNRDLAPYSPHEWKLPDALREVATDPDTESNPLSQVAKMLEPCATSTAISYFLCTKGEMNKMCRTV
jgi:hypothetical protein